MSTSLDMILGEKLSSIEFVLDYHQLRFDGPCLTAFSHPIIEVGDTSYKWGEPGYRDALCERIAKIVRKATIIEDEQVRIEFDDGSIISISLRPEAYAGPEAAMFMAGPVDDLYCWVL